MAQCGGTFLLRRAGREQKSGLTPGHPGDPAPEKICSDTGFCCAQFRVSPACLLLLLMGKESAIVRRPRAPLSLLCSRGDVKVVRGNPTGQPRAGQAGPVMLQVCWPSARQGEMLEGSLGAEHRLQGQELCFAPCKTSQHCRESWGWAGQMLQQAAGWECGGCFSLSQRWRYQ